MDTKTAPTKLSTGAAILQMKPKTDDSWTVLADTGEHQAQRWAVWTCFFDGTCIWGNYFSSLADAARYFEGAGK